MRSGMGVHRVLCRCFTPSIVITALPAPRTLPPIALMKFAKSTISGSRAALWITEIPGSSTAAIRIFSVAPTLG